MVGVVDYGLGNLRSVQTALARVGCNSALVSEPSRLKKCSHVILPGVGAFSDAMSRLNHGGWVDAVRDFAASGRPLLGICLGMQVLFDRGLEGGSHAGIGLFRGECVPLTPAAGGIKVPHMGWNGLEFPQPSKLFEGVPAGASVYFVHGYHVLPVEREVVVAVTDHGGPVVAAVARGNLFATQFHPEKSQQVGRRVLRNFVSL
jgi:glutamine amidotransferase